MKFEQWVKKQNDDFFKVAGMQENRRRILAYAIGIANKKDMGLCAGAISNRPYRVSTYIKGKRIVTQIISMRKQKRGVAICHENDAFDPEIGIAYAWARYKNESIPNFTVAKKLSEMKNGDVFITKDRKYVFIGAHPESRAMQQRYVIWNMNANKLETTWESEMHPIKYEVIT